MGSRSKTLGRGVRIRIYPSGLQRIEIQFQYRKVVCKEVLKNLDPEKAANRKFALNLKAEIENAKVRGSFNYATFFPDSPRAQLFGHAASSTTVAQAQKALICDLDRAGLEQTTLAAYWKSAKRINKYLGTHYVVNLQPADIRAMIRSRPVSRKTWNNDLIPLRRALRRAVNDSMILVSPLDRIDLNELVPRHKRPKPDPFSMAEIQTILICAKDYCPRAHNLFEFAFFTGLRLEEIAGLQWEDVDLKKKQIHISGAAMLSVRSSAIKSPKTGAGKRTIHLLPRAAAALKRQHSITRFRGQNVFSRWNSLQPFSSYEQLRSRWATVLEKSKVRPRPLSHARHTYASHQLSSGVNPLYLAEQLGHAGTTLLDIYSTWVNDWRNEHQTKKYGY